MIKTSLVVPHYNNSRFQVQLADNLDLILKDKSIEVIVVDDHSTDKSAVYLAKRFKNQDRFVLHTSQTNEGAAASRNKGVKLSSGRYIVFQDCDDTSTLKRFQIHLKHLERNDAIVSFVSSVKYYGQTKREYKLLTQEKLCLSIDDYSHYIFFGKKSSRHGPLHFPSACMAISRELYDHCAGFNERLRRVEDVDFVFRAIKSGAKFSTSSSLEVVRMENSVAHNSASENAKAELALLKEHGSNGLTSWEMETAVNLIKIRESYFKHDTLSLLKLAIILLKSNPLILAQKVFGSGLKRAIFDLRKRFFTQ